jgi:hypothetical protein
MAFRRDSSRALRWQQWLAKHHDALVSIGLPDWLYACERRWTHFLQEGGIDWESRWSVELLSHEQARHLREFVVSEYGPDEHRCCVRVLELALTREPKN